MPDPESSSSRNPLTHRRGARPKPPSGPVYARAIRDDPHDTLGDTYDPTRTYTLVKSNQAPTRVASGARLEIQDVEGRDGEKFSLISRSK